MLNLSFSPFPNLTTERLRLRRLTINDANEVLLLRSDERVNKFIDRPKAITIDDAISFIHKIENGVANNESVYWAITKKEEDTLIGTICLWNISKEDERAEIGYELHPDLQGKALMQEAICKVVEYGFYTMNLKVITAEVNKDNIRSIKLLEKTNFISDLDFIYGNKEALNDYLIYFRLKD